MKKYVGYLICAFLTILMIKLLITDDLKKNVKMKHEISSSRFMEIYLNHSGYLH